MGKGFGRVWERVELLMGAWRVICLAHLEGEIKLQVGSGWWYSYWRGLFVN